MKRHFTATAFVIDSKKRTILMWHKRLNRWMPPGGHVDPDEIPEEAARRECKEETGLDVEIIGDSCEDLFVSGSKEGKMLKKPTVLLLENIPACEERGEAAHQHMDFVYLAKPLDESQEIIVPESEATDWRWFDRAAIEELNEETEIFGNVKRYALRFM
ncbi:NUDIX domain-containing protein [Candidatus Peribacteria bacterium]|jgi:8-oxo-dGTP pyrophosphatase MutT (NUDIX family)|nr:NUDIX domain-containing protein [Candidatus Peribacteria bacterium]MBT4021135.1 NUDIX domain-containing protein [Candidatus Peribacteria bacterium]MBT4240867.1 NUDIX domain-containing protein [Candidatus Peribacteria bacterium]MBT4474655.1 NUDIX domain-containing protein [Candidatus Peribacteria bacterium]